MDLCDLDFRERFLCYAPPVSEDRVDGARGVVESEKRFDGQLNFKRT